MKRQEILEKILAEEVDEYFKLMRLAVQSIEVCPICHKKYIKGQSEYGCPYCKVRCLVEDSENAMYENALHDII